jgi:outer membrane protein OmpA-like peptidoglycan-associated protein
VAQSGRLLTTFRGDGDLPGTLDWDMNFEQNSIPQGSEPLEYVLRVSDSTGQDFSARGTVQLQQKKLDTEVGRYSLILFDFNKAAMNAYNRRIADMIRATIDPGATVKITGYSDRIGELDYNQKLSEDRARNTARILGLRDAQVEGLGKSVLLYDNSLPEGRFYSRTVNILQEKNAK